MVQKMREERPPPHFLLHFFRNFRRFVLKMFVHFQNWGPTYWNLDDRKIENRDKWGIFSYPAWQLSQGQGRPSPVFGPSKFGHRRKIVLQIVAFVYIEPCQIQTTGSKRLKEGSNRYGKEVLLIHGVYSQIFLKLRDSDHWAKKCSKK